MRQRLVLLAATAVAGCMLTVTGVAAGATEVDHFTDGSFPERSVVDAPAIIVEPGGLSPSPPALAAYSLSSRPTPRFPTITFALRIALSGVRLASRPLISEQ
jgi:hypothetical protein